MIEIEHPTGILKCAVKLPASKSISNRVLLLKKLYAPELIIHNLSEARDSTVMEAALDSNSHIDVQDAGTVTRFMIAYCAISDGNWTLDGTRRMAERPIIELVEALQILGAKIDYLEEQGKLPVQITGTLLSGSDTIDLSSVKSSQSISALLMILPKIKGTFGLKVNPYMNSYSYVKLTLDIMRTFGFEFELNNNVISYKGLHSDLPESIDVEPDYTAMFYWFSLAALSKESDLLITDLKEESIQYESTFLQNLAYKGLDLKFENQGLRITKHADQITSLPESLDFRNCPDLAPTLILLASMLESKEYLIGGLESLRYKESDREAVLISYLIALNAEMNKHGNLWILAVKNPLVHDNHRFQVYQDHRMAMSLAPLGLIERIQIEDEHVVNKSYPGFWDDLKLANFVINKLN